jgi:hypothetical protein
MDNEDILKTATEDLKGIQAILVALGMDITHDLPLTGLSESLLLLARQVLKISESLETVCKSE